MGCCGSVPDSEGVPRTSSTTSVPMLQPTEQERVPQQSMLSPTVQELITNFQEIDIESQGDDFIEAMKEYLSRVQMQTDQDAPSPTSSHSDKHSTWDSIIRSGGRLLEYLSNEIEKMKIDDNSLYESGKAIETVRKIAQQIGNVRWAVAGLSVVGYLVYECAKASTNRTECLELLREMITLFSHIIDLNKHIADRTDMLEKAFEYIIEGSICCASQLHSGSLFRFLKTTVNSEKLKAIHSKLTKINTDLGFAINFLPDRLPEENPSYGEMINHTTFLPDRLPKENPSYGEIIKHTTLLPDLLPKENLSYKEMIKHTTLLPDRLPKEIPSYGGDKEMIKHTTLLPDRLPKENPSYREMIKHTTLLPDRLPKEIPSYGVGIVGIGDQLKIVNELLNMENTNDCSSMAVVIWGFNGIGKTTLANAVVSVIDRKRYNYAKIELSSVPEENSYKKIQQQILRDAFPRYLEGRKVGLRDDADGRDHIAAAFRCGANKPVFLYIDNVLRIKDLEKILAEDLRGLPGESRIVVTSRFSGVTDVLEESGLRCKDHRLKPLSHDHALTILCNHPATPVAINDLLKICNGIPLLLKMVAADLGKQKYKADRCMEILEALQTVDKINEEELSTRFFHFIYKDLKESTREAFLDICCFFNKELRRFVEHILDPAEVTFLVDAAFITTPMNEEEEEILSVHDIIRSIGRSITESSRIMDKNSWFAVQEDEAKLERVRGVWVKSGHCVLRKEHLDSMRKTLRVLMWKGRINGSATDAGTFPELRYIRTKTDICGLKIEALDKLAVFSCKKLPIKPTDYLKMQLPESLRWFQADAMQDLSKVSPNSSLEELYLTFSEQSELSDAEKDYSRSPFDKFLRGLNKLKHLRVNHQSLIELPKQVCSLQQLTTLRIINCYKLQSLPDSFGQLKGLRELDLSGCLGLKELPSTFGDLTTLRKLNLTWCESLKKLPLTFNNLRSLEYLCLIKCHNLQSDICQIDDNIRIVEKSHHYCINCQQNRKLKIIYS